MNLAKKNLHDIAIESYWVNNDARDSDMTANQQVVDIIELY